jgi:hypothetical protein
MNKPERITGTSQKRNPWERKAIFSLGIEALSFYKRKGSSATTGI